jgi:uncharacterized glyoxalase superfamily protein PhnB
MGVEAFGIYRSPKSLSTLLDILRGADPPPYLRDQVVLSMASILDIQNQFYHLLVRFLEDESLVVTLALDEAEAAVEFYNSAFGGRKKRALVEIGRQAKTLQTAVSAYVRDHTGALLSRWIQELPDEIADMQVKIILSEAVLDDELVILRRLQLLIAHWSARELREWTRRLKGQGSLF